MFNNNSTRNNKSSTQSSSSALASQPQSVFYPISLPFYNYLPTQALPLASQTSSTIANDKPIPTIQEFLENLDSVYGSQKFTCFLEKFVNESIDVLDIQMLTDNDFEKLGISSIGIKTKLVREAKRYSQ